MVFDMGEFVAIKVITDADFDEIVGKSPNLFALDFWAPWCGPCRQLIPILEEISIDGVEIGKLCVDDNPGISAKYRIMSLPTIILFKSGAEIDRKIGFIDKTTLINWLEGHKG